MSAMIKRINSTSFVFLRRSLVQLSVTQNEQFILDKSELSLQVLDKRLLIKQDNGNTLRIKRLAEGLDMDKYGIPWRDKAEIKKCFYPTKQSEILINSKEYFSNKHLEILGQKMLDLVINETLLQLFKRTSMDIGQYDFNYALKMNSSSCWRKGSILLVRDFLKRKGLGDLARLAIPESRLPARIQSVYDQKSFNAVIGYIIKSNDPQIVDCFLKNSVAKDLLRSTLAR